MSLGAATHAFDQNQRAVFLQLGIPSQSNGDYVYPIESPYGADFAPPGYYMLFVMTPKTGSVSGTNRVPSEAVFIKLLL